MISHHLFSRKEVSANYATLERTLTGKSEFGNFRALPTELPLPKSSELDSNQRPRLSIEVTEIYATSEYMQGGKECERHSFTKRSSRLLRRALVINTGWSVQVVEQNVKQEKRQAPGILTIPKALAGRSNSRASRRGVHK